MAARLQLLGACSSSGAAAISSLRGVSARSSARLMTPVLGAQFLDRAAPLAMHRWQCETRRRRRRCQRPRCRHRLLPERPRPTTAALSAVDGRKLPTAWADLCAAVQDAAAPRGRRAVTCRGSSPRPPTAPLRCTSLAALLHPVRAAGGRQYAARQPWRACGPPGAGPGRLRRPGQGGAASPGHCQANCAAIALVEPSRSVRPLPGAAKHVGRVPQGAAGLGWAGRHAGAVPGAPPPPGCAAPPAAEQAHSSGVLCNACRPCAGSSPSILPAQPFLLR